MLKASINNNLDKTNQKKNIGKNIQRFMNADAQIENRKNVSKAIQLSLTSTNPHRDNDNDH